MTSQTHAAFFNDDEQRKERMKSPVNRISCCHDNNILTATLLTVKQSCLFACAFLLKISMIFYFHLTDIK